MATSNEGAACLSFAGCSSNLPNRDGVVERAVAVARLAVRVGPVGAWLEGPAERRRRRRLPQPVERGDRGAAERGLGDRGERDRPRQRVGHELAPGGTVLEPAARRDDLLDLREQLDDGREAEGDALERGLPQVARRGVEAQAPDGAADVCMPARAPLAAEEREEREPVVGGVALGERLLVLVRAENPLEPAVEVAAV